jgi:hypothetical protein
VTGAEAARRIVCSLMRFFGLHARAHPGAICRRSSAAGTAYSSAFGGGPKEAFGRESFQRVARQSRFRILDHRLHHCASAPACGRRKRGSENEAIGRSRGGLSTKISAGVDALGNPLRFILTAGQVNDICQAEDLISGLSFDKAEIRPRRRDTRHRIRGGRLVGPIGWPRPPVPDGQPHVATLCSPPDQHRHAIAANKTKMLRGAEAKLPFRSRRTSGATRLRTGSLQPSPCFEFRLP